MRLLAVSLLIAGTALFAQTQVPLGPSPTGFGRMINPSGIPPAQGGAGFGRQIYPGTGGPPVAIRRGNIGFGRHLIPPAVRHPNHSQAVIVPYPVFYGGDFYDYGAPPPEGAGYDTSGYDQNYQNYGGPPQSPVVIINQNFRPDTVNPVVRDYSNAPLPPPNQDQNNPDQSNAQPPDQAQNQVSINNGSPVVFLIAMKDHTIFPAVAYWVDGDTLNYITIQGVHNRASLDLVDRDFSKQLNDERHVDFALPAPK